MRCALVITHTHTHTHTNPPLIIISKIKPDCCSILSVLITHLTCPSSSFFSIWHLEFPYLKIRRLIFWSLLMTRACGTKSGLKDFSKFRGGAVCLELSLLFIVMEWASVELSFPDFTVQMFGRSCVYWYWKWWTRRCPLPRVCIDVCRFHDWIVIVLHCFSVWPGNIVMSVFVIGCWQLWRWEVCHVRRCPSVRNGQGDWRIKRGKKFTIA